MNLLGLVTYMLPSSSMAFDNIFWFGQIKILWYTRILMKNYLALKNKLTQFATTYMELEDNMISKMSENDTEWCLWYVEYRIWKLLFKTELAEGKGNGWVGWPIWEKSLRWWLREASTMVESVVLEHYMHNSRTLIINSIVNHGIFKRVLKWCSPSAFGHLFLLAQAGEPCIYHDMICWLRYNVMM